MPFARSSRTVLHEKTDPYKLQNMRLFDTVCPVSPRGTAPFRAVALDGIQAFRIRALILNFMDGTARNKRFSGETGYDLDG